jgi:[protein-PII] uridylyltransferase
MEESRHTGEGAASRPHARSEWLAGHRTLYAARMQAIRESYAAGARRLEAGALAVAARSALVDELVRSAWSEVMRAGELPHSGVALIALGGYGRRELFPSSDVDLMFLLDGSVAEEHVRRPLSELNQMLWDVGMKVSPLTRTLRECARFDAENVEFALSLLDARPLAGDSALGRALLDDALPKLLSEEATRIAARLLEVTRTRHARYGDTLFHLEPNIKDCPGGLRDVHVCQWMKRLQGDPAVPEQDRDFIEARSFLLLVRVFLHLRSNRDDNTLDWLAQDAAAAAGLGIAGEMQTAQAAYWMRLYFRHARSVERAVSRLIEEAGPAARVRPLPAPFVTEAAKGFELKQGRIGLIADAVPDLANDPELVLSLFGAMAATGARLGGDSASRLEKALPVLSRDLEDGPGLWRRLKAILLGPFAGSALRSMHALGILELVLPEFHGIDALVIRDAYHRYTVDEHTFVLIDTLHALASSGGSSATPREHALASWSARFGQLFRDLPHPELLLLGSLLHDTGKGHASDDHAAESTRMAASVLNRLELDSYETGLVLDLIGNHLEMSNALRRDVFDPETISSFAGRVPNPEVLRMLTLFTYADINAVHPDALTPWKAENLWRLFNATTNWLDRSVDDERVAADANSERNDLLMRIHALLPKERARVNEYLEGFPQRYLQTRTPETIRTHIEMAGKLERQERGVALDFRYAPGVSEITLVSNDRPALFASMAGALAAWGMNIITADAFSNAQGVVVDSFRFTDPFRTLELNESERERFVLSVRDVMTGVADLEPLLSSRRRGRGTTAKTRVEPRIVFDDSASKHSTLLQVVAQDVPGLLRALSRTLAEHACNIEVALVDTEGESAIDVFYLTKQGQRLPATQQDLLRHSLREAIEENER